MVLKQRQDELTKLIDAAQEMMEYEEELLTQLTEAREQSAWAETPQEQAEADVQVREAMAAFEARVEEYPELSAQENMQQFQERITDIGSQPADRREFYNKSTTRYNTRISQFPYLIFARQFGFGERELYGRQVLVGVANGRYRLYLPDEPPHGTGRDRYGVIAGAAASVATLAGLELGVGSGTLLLCCSCCPRCVCCRSSPTATPGISGHTVTGRVARCSGRHSRCSPG